MQRDRELDHPEAAPEVAACRGDGRDDCVADLAGELFELQCGEVAKLSRPLQGWKDRRTLVVRDRHRSEGSGSVERGVARASSPLRRISAGGCDVRPGL